MGARLFRIMRLVDRSRSVPGGHPDSHLEDLWEDLRHDLRHHARARARTGAEPLKKGDREMKGTTAFLMVAMGLTLPLGLFADSDDHHVMARLVEIDGSGVQGMVNVVNVPGGT